MPYSKLYDTHTAAVAGIRDGATVLVGGASHASEPTGLLNALHRSGAADLTIVCDLAGWDGSESIPRLAAAGRIARLISSFPFLGATGGVIPELWDLGDVEVVAVPQGTLAERLRAAGAGIGGIFVPTGLGTRFASDAETMIVNGVECVLETPLRADYALLRAHHADTVGNLAYQGAQRHWNATMAPAARTTIVEADRVDEPGSIDPELVITPGIYVNRIVRATPAATA